MPDSDLALNAEEVTKLLRSVIRRESEGLNGVDRILCVHLSNSIVLNSDMGVDNEEHASSLVHIDRLTGVIGKFDSELTEAVVKELGM